MSVGGADAFGWAMSAVASRQLPTTSGRLSSSLCDIARWRRLLKLDQARAAMLARAPRALGRHFRVLGTNGVGGEAAKAVRRRKAPINEATPFAWMHEAKSDASEATDCAQRTERCPPPLPPSPIELLIAARLQLGDEIESSHAASDEPNTYSRRRTDDARNVAMTKQALLIWHRLTDEEREEFLTLGEDARLEYLHDINSCYKLKASTDDDTADALKAFDLWHANKLRANAKTTAKKLLLPSIRPYGARS
jgi:hypothetical protein